MKTISPLSYFVFKSDINPTKFIIGLASMIWPITELLINHKINLFFVLMFLYGLGLFWRIFDYKHRPACSFTLSTIGASLWTYETWSNVIHNLDASNVEIIDILGPGIMAITSLWILMRSGSGEIINTSKRFGFFCYPLRRSTDRKE